MRELEVMIGLICLGFLLLIIGYSRRDHNSGVITIMLGILIMFSTLAYKLYLEFGT